MAGIVISSIIAFVCIGTFVAQIVGGTAIVGLDRFIERKKTPRQYWFVIGVEALALLVWILSFLAFQFGILV